MACKHEFIFWSFEIQKCVHCTETRKRFGVVRVTTKQHKPRKKCAECGQRVRGVNHSLHCKRKVS